MRYGGHYLAVGGLFRGPVCEVKVGFLEARFVKEEKGRDQASSLLSRVFLGKRIARASEGDVIKWGARTLKKKGI